MGATCKASHPASGPAAWKATRRPQYEGGGASGSAPFEGILDQLNTAPVGAWSVARRLTVDYAGPLVRLRRTSDNAESDFGFDAGGGLDTTATATWLGGASGRVVAIYDQIGMDHLTMATAGTQPTYDADEIGGKPCAAFAGTHALVATGAVCAALSGNDNYRTLAGVLRIRTGTGFPFFGGANAAPGSPLLHPVADRGNSFTTINAVVGGLAPSDYQTYSATPKSVSLFAVYGADLWNLWWGAVQHLTNVSSPTASMTFTSVSMGASWRTDTAALGNGSTCWWSEMIAWAADATADQAACAADVSAFYGV